MVRNTTLVTLVVLNLVVRSAPAQSVIQRRFDDFQRQALTEKIFVHTDKETYLTGETIRFSLYVVDGLIHHPLDLSKIAYVEVIDRNKTPILQAKVQLKEGRGSGTLDIPDVASEAYTLRAYTRWMRNSAADYFFEKELVVLNSSQPNAVRVLDTANASDDQPEITVRFFPEGGQLVQDLKSKVAFQATGKDGKGIDITGYIRNEAGDTVALFKSLKFGIGNFLLTPQPGHRYDAVVSYAGKQSHHTLPPIHASGYVLNVNTLNNGKIHVVISRAGIATSDTMMLFIHTRNKTKVTLATTLKDGQAGFLVDRNKLGEGISHFTVFNGRGQPVCERLYFIRPAEQLKVDVTMEKNSYTTRGKATMNINTSKNNSSLPASLSLSVYRLDPTQITNPLNIHHYLMLSSDLKGEVESPEYYFTSNDDVVNEATDNLMLTHGWRRFVWSDILEGKTVSRPFTPEYEGIVISGRMFRGDSTARAINEKAYLSFPGTDPQFFTAQTDGNGHFEFLVKNPVGRKEVVIQAARNPELYTVLLDESFSTEYSKEKIQGVKLNDDLKDVVLLNAIHSQAKSYFHKETTAGEESIDSALFFGTPDKTYDLDDYQRFPTMEDVMREYVPEVTVMTKGKRNNIYVLNRKKEEFFAEDPLLLVDGIPVSSTHRVTVMAAANVKTLDIISQRYRLGPVSFGGIVSLKTTNGRLGGLEPEPGAYAFDFEGLQVEREFYSPVYSPDQQSSRIPDFRSVLYWQPNLRTSGGEQVSFFTSDEVGTFVVVVQGLAEGGMAGCGTFTFSVHPR